VHVLIRPAAAADCEEAARVAAALPLLVRYGTTGDGLARTLTAALARGEGVLVACTPAGRVLGFAWYLATGTFSHAGYLRLIAITADAQSRGVGARLLAEVETAVYPSGELFLLVSEFNQAAQRFYESHGYARVGKLPGYVKPDIDELIYWKRLG
jgi:ribosomal protein S18 acetylase RimI-like enzyme